MKKSGVAYDSDAWNLDGLELNPKFREPGIGKVLLKRVDAPASPSWRVGLFPNLLRRSLILILRPEDGVLQRIEAGDVTATELLTWQHRDPLDMFVEHHYTEQTFDGGDVKSRSYSASFIYLLRRPTGELTRYKLFADELVDDGAWRVSPYSLTPGARVAVAPGPRGRDGVAYVGPCNGGTLIRLSLDDGRVEEFDAKLPGGGWLRLGDEVHLCVDGAKGSLLVADTASHLIYEVDYQTAEARVVCGAGEPGESPEGTPAVEARIDSPRALAIYRPFELIDEAHLHGDSAELLKEDYLKIRPRTIIFADSGNRKVKKIVDAGARPDEQLTYTLLGSGGGGAAPPDAPGGRAADLRAWPINVPFDLAVSNLGELLVACASAEFLILLRPATTVLRESAYLAGLGDTLYVS